MPSQLGHVHAFDVHTERCACETTRVEDFVASGGGATIRYVPTVGDARLLQIVDLLLEPDASLRLGSLQLGAASGSNQPENPC